MPVALEGDRNFRPCLYWLDSPPKKDSALSLVADAARPAPSERWAGTGYFSDQVFDAATTDFKTGFSLF